MLIYWGNFWKRSCCPLFMYMNNPHGFFQIIEQFLPLWRYSQLPHFHVQMCWLTAVYFKRWLHFIRTLQNILLNVLKSMMNRSSCHIICTLGKFFPSLVIKNNNCQYHIVARNFSKVDLPIMSCITDIDRNKAIWSHYHPLQL